MFEMKVVMVFLLSLYESLKIYRQTASCEILLAGGIKIDGNDEGTFVFVTIMVMVRVAY